MVGRAIVLDSGVLGLASNPRTSADTEACRLWLRTLLDTDRLVFLPELADYEVRRELIRAKKVNGLARLDYLCESLEYLPITTAAMRRAAELWAEARQAGRPTAGNASLDGDVILAAQALTLGVEVVVATTNAGHLGRYVPAADWRDMA